MEINDADEGFDGRKGRVLFHEGAKRRAVDADKETGKVELEYPDGGSAAPADFAHLGLEVLQRPVDALALAAGEA